MSSLDREVSEVAEKVLAVIEQTRSKELESSSEITEILHLTDVHDAKKLLRHIDKVSTQPEQRNASKRALIKASLLTTWLHRLYFVIRCFYES
jgi:RNA polymerase-interacting CarD/CdnL/TRCF family regulator